MFRKWAAGRGGPPAGTNDRFTWPNRVSSYQHAIKLFTIIYARYEHCGHLFTELTRRTVPYEKIGEHFRSVLGGSGNWELGIGVSVLYCCVVAGGCLAVFALFIGPLKMLVCV